MALTMIIIKFARIFQHRLSSQVAAYHQWLVVTKELHDGLDGKSPFSPQESYAKYLETMLPVLVSIGYSPDAISTTLAKTEFLPKSNVDPDKDLRKHRNAGNDAFEKRQFATALSKYALALKLKNLSNDTRAILHSTCSACHLELKQFAQARSEAKLAIRLAPLWYEPWRWFFSASNAIGKFKSVKKHAPVVIHLFPEDGRANIQEALRTA